MESTIKTEILAYLQREGASWSGVVCRAVHDITGSKEEVIARRLRELHNEGKLERCLKQVEGKGPWCVHYRLPLNK